MSSFSLSAALSVVHFGQCVSILLPSLIRACSFSLSFSPISAIQRVVFVRPHSLRLYHGYPPTPFLLPLPRLPHVPCVSTTKTVAMSTVRWFINLSRVDLLSSPLFGVLFRFYFLRCYCCQGDERVPSRACCALDTVCLPPSPRSTLSLVVFCL